MGADEAGVDADDCVVLGTVSAGVPSVAAAEAGAVDVLCCAATCSHQEK